MICMFVTMSDPLSHTTSQNASCQFGASVTHITVSFSGASQYSCLDSTQFSYAGDTAKWLHNSVHLTGPSRNNPKLLGPRTRENLFSIRLQRPTDLPNSWMPLCYGWMEDLFDIKVCHLVSFLWFFIYTHQVFYNLWDFEFLCLSRTRFWDIIFLIIVFMSLQNNSETNLHN